MNAQGAVAAILFPCRWPWCLPALYMEGIAWGVAICDLAGHLVFGYGLTGGDVPVLTLILGPVGYYVGLKVIPLPVLLFPKVRKTTVDYDEAHGKVIAGFSHGMMGLFLLSLIRFLSQSIPAFQGPMAWVGIALTGVGIFALIQGFSFLTGRMLRRSAPAEAKA